MKANKKMLGTIGLALALVSLPPLEGVKLTDYRDPVGIPTACMGHTATAEVGRVRTLAECYGLMYDDVYEHYLGVEKHVQVPLQPHQLSALVLFTYNVGETAFRNSTLLKKVNAGDFEGASREFLKWVYATEVRNGQKVKVKLNGLVKRRSFESAMFLGQVDLDTEAYEALPEVTAEELEEAEEALDEYSVAEKPEPQPWWRSLLGPSFFALRQG